MDHGYKAGRRVSPEELDGLLRKDIGRHFKSNRPGAFHVRLLYCLITVELAAIICLGFLLDRKTCSNPALKLWCESGSQGQPKTPSSADSLILPSAC